MHNINLVYFSPTNTTKKVLKAIYRGINSSESKHFDLTLPQPENAKFHFPENELAIFGIPVYGGRVPKEAVQRLMGFKGNNTPAVIVAVYGNRDFDDAILELNDLVVSAGFVPFAAAAFIGEHSYSTTEKPIAQNRPDAADLKIAADFGKQIGERLNNKGSLEKLSTVPGNSPYKQTPEKPLMSPVTIESKCIKCGICVSVCPTEAIEMNEVMETDSAACIMCCACIKECPTDARVNDNEMIKTISQRLYENCSMRKEPELFW